MPSVLVVLCGAKAASRELHLSSVGKRYKCRNSETCNGECVVLVTGEVVVRKEARGSGSLARGA